MTNTKQVIVIRKDLKMRKGKMCSQAAHASMSFLTKNTHIETEEHGTSYTEHFLRRTFDREFALEINHWLKNSFRKICVYVNSEDELEEVHNEALRAGLVSYLIEDNGTTEFNNVPTKTCLAIGPHYDEKFVGVTDKLPLL